MQVPYVHFDTYKNVTKMKEEVASVRMEAKEQLLPPGHWLGHSNEICSEENTKASERHHQRWKATDLIVQTFPETSIDVIKKYLHSNLPVHCRKTLSQYYYHSRLQKPKQVVTSHFEELWTYEDPLTLMVDQLWMIVLANGMNLLWN